MEGELKVPVFSCGFALLDTGLCDSLVEPFNNEKRLGLKAVDVEDITFRRSRIIKERIREIA